MNIARQLIGAMAEKCREVIAASEPAEQGPSLERALGPGHLLWMCARIGEHAEDWPEPRLHRWIGFVQAGILANRMLDLDGVRAMFDAARKAFGARAADQDLADHLDRGNAFEIELGGQG